MKERIKTLGGIAVATVLALSAAGAAQADKLDDIIDSGELRCSVTLDFPPIGYRDQNNEPAGFDVEYCKDMAKALGVEAVIVDTPFPDRIPALVSNRADISIASASDTLERAKTVAFSVPYIAYTNKIVTRKDTGIQAFDDLKGRKVGGVSGTTPEQNFLEHFKKWGNAEGDYVSYQSDADQYLALAQGKIDAFVTASTTAATLVNSGKYQDFVAAGEAPFPVDICGIMVNRHEYGFLNWVNLFVNRQVRSGRYQELYEEYVGGEAPKLAVSGVYY